MRLGDGNKLGKIFSDFFVENIQLSCPYIESCAQVVCHLKTNMLIEYNSKYVSDYILYVMLQSI